MKRLKSSVVAQSAVAAIILFWILNELVSYDKMLEISSSLVLGITFAVMVRWSRDAASALRTGRDGYQFLITGVYAIITILFFQRVWVIVVRVYERADFLVYTPIGAFIAWMLAWSCSMVLIAPDAEDGSIPNKSRMMIAIALFVAGLVSGISIAAALWQ